MKSYFLTEKEGRRPLQKAMIQALLPTDKEAPKLQKKEDKKDAKKDDAKVRRFAFVMVFYVTELPTHRTRKPFYPARLFEMLTGLWDLGRP